MNFEQGRYLFKKEETERNVETLEKNLIYDMHEYRVNILKSKRLKKISYYIPKRQMKIFVIQSQLHERKTSRKISSEKNMKFCWHV